MNATEIALRALAAATTPQVMAEAAAACEGQAVKAAKSAPLEAQDHEQAATLLRQVDAAVERAPGLRIGYVGVPVGVAISNIDEDEMVVPDATDPECGDATATLFNEAVAAKALVPPDGVTIECYGDDDYDGGGFVLVAFPEVEGKVRGVTCGWRDVENLKGMSTPEALEFMAEELNTALGARPLLCPACGKPPEMLCDEELVALRRAAPDDAPAHAAMCEDEAGWRCANVNCARFAA